MDTIAGTMRRHVDAGRIGKNPKGETMTRLSTTLTLLACAAALAPLAAGPAAAQDRSAMSFFVTSANPGQGGNLGGLAGADRHCQTLAAAAGSRRTWRAYLSTQAAGGQPAVNARERIGAGPWRNAAGVVIAQNVAELHGTNSLTKQTALNERGEIVNGRGDNPNQHDILTGSQPDGTAFATADDMTCRNYTSDDAGAVMVGHSDRTGLDDSAPARSWNSSHPSRGCSLAALRTTGSAGFLYCFAID